MLRVAQRDRQGWQGFTNAPSLQPSMVTAAGPALRVTKLLISVPDVLGQAVGKKNAMVCLHQFLNNYIFNCLLTPSTQVTSLFVSITKNSLLTMGFSKVSSPPLVIPFTFALAHLSALFQSW